MSELTTIKFYWAGLCFSILIYGVHLTLYASCLLHLYNKRGKAYFAYFVLLFSLATTGIVLQFHLFTTAFVDNYEYSGGPLQYVQDHINSGLMQSTILIYVILGWLVEAMLMYRSYVIVRLHQWRRRCMFSVILLSSATLIVTGILFLPGTAHLVLDQWADTPLKRGMLYLGVSLSISIIITFFIVTHLLLSRRALRKSGLRSTSQTHKPVIILLVGSASVYLVVAILALILFEADSPMQYVLISALGQLQAIPQLLIAHRAAKGDHAYRDIPTQPPQRVHSKLSIRIPEFLSDHDQRLRDIYDQPLRKSCDDSSRKSDLIKTWSVHGDSTFYMDLNDHIKPPSHPPPTYTSPISPTRTICNV